MTKQQRMPQRKPLRLKGFNYADAGYTYLVTIRVANQGISLLQPALTKAVKDAIQWLRGLGALVHCYCIMPDHLHLLISLYQCDRSLPDLIRGLKYATTRVARKSIWQRSFHDHILRPSEDAAEVCRYILENPIRKGLTNDFDQWPHAGMLDEL